VKDPHIVWSARSIVLAALALVPGLAAVILTVIYAASCCYQNSPGVKHRRDTARREAAARLHEEAMTEWIRAGRDRLIAEA
jgi:hypothetical protein